MILSERFLRHVSTHSLIGPGDRLVVAVSGGADSMALLHLLCHTRRELGLQLCIAHYDHHLRPSSVRDRLFVKDAAERLNLPFETEINRRPLPKTGSLEEIARDWRYDFLIRSAVKFKADALVTAHTRDDLAETVLMRMMRGTGLHGLQAILPRRTFRGCVLVRPMLVFSRREVERFNKEQKVKFVTDPSNRSLDFERNKIRSVLIPYLEKQFNPAVKENLARLADIAAVDQSFIDGQGARFLKSSAKISANKISISLAAFKQCHCSLRRTILRSAFALIDEKARSLTMAHVAAVDAALFEDDPGQAFGRKPLPLKAVFTCKGNRLSIERKKH